MNVIRGSFAFADLGVILLEVAVVGTGSDVVCANILSTSPMMVIPSSVRYWRFNCGNKVSVMQLLTNAVAYAWAVSGGMPALQNKVATKSCHLLLHKYTNAKMNKNKSVLTQHQFFLIKKNTTLYCKTWREQVLLSLFWWAYPQFCFHSVAKHLIHLDPELEIIRIKSVTCSTQYKCKYVFGKIKKLASERGIPVVCYHGVSGHGKRFVDAMSGFRAKGSLR